VPDFLGRCVADRTVFCHMTAHGVDPPSPMGSVSGSGFDDANAETFDFSDKPSAAAGGGVGYPRRPPLRCGRRSLDIVCSISQNIQTKAAPRAITTIKNINVNAGAVSMFNIPDVTRTTYLKQRSR
jgi:hypothetical protein